MPCLSGFEPRLLFLRDWSFKSVCECDLWRAPLLETIGLPAGRVLCILVIVKNYGILGDFGLNWATCKSFVISL